MFCNWLTLKHHNSMRSHHCFMSCFVPVFVNRMHMCGHNAAELVQLVPQLDIANLSAFVQFWTLFWLWFHIVVIGSVYTMQKNSVGCSSVVQLCTTYSKLLDNFIYRMNPRWRIVRLAEQSPAKLGQPYMGLFIGWFWCGYVKVPFIHITVVM